MKYFITIPILLVFFSCQNPNKYEMIIDFPATTDLSCETITIPAQLFTPAGLILLDSAIITLDLKADTIFQLFKYPSFEHLTSFMKRGSGPNEEIFIDPFIQQISDNKFIYKNLNSVKIVEYNIHKQNLEVIEEIKLPAELMDFFHIINLGDRIIGVRSDVATNKELTSYDTLTNSIMNFGANYPKVINENRLTDRDKIQLFAKAMTAKPDGKMFACVYDKFPILRIFSENGQMIKEVRLKNGQSFPTALTKSNPSDSEIGEITQNYRMIKSTDNYIYALYIGKKNKDLEPGLNDFSNIIHIWDWNGNPISKLVLDNKIFTFDVSKDDKYLIACSLEKLDELYKYNLFGK